MANPEHLQILQQGVERWNAWREQHRDISPDLKEADLRGSNLSHANLINANLYHANLGATLVDGPSLRKADLTGAILRGADLLGADLSFAILTGATLREADLRGAKLTLADLSSANLTEASLDGADLTGANLTGADVSKVYLYETVFGDTNLTAVRGLETCDHRGPSTLDHRTLAKSGPLPLAFLRSCGLPDTLIEYLPSLLGEPVQFYCLISHASKDYAFAERLYADLQNKGVRCWYAPEDLPIGAKIRMSIDESIRVCDKLLLILSRHSVASQWVEQEVETALAQERQQGTTILFPVRLDNTVMTLETGGPALIRNTRNIGDFRRWKTHGVYQQAFTRLLRDLTTTARRQLGG